jgi:ABC-type iron transport system FetAB ATPase subunit
MNTVFSQHITKRYGSVEALKGVDLQVREGELFGIIGADGAGKTTLFRILTTLVLLLMLWLFGRGERRQWLWTSPLCACGFWWEGRAVVGSLWF